MNNNFKFLDIIKNLFQNRIYLGILFGSFFSTLILAALYFKFIAPSFYNQMITNVTDEAKRIGSHIKWHQSENITIDQLEKLRIDFGLYKVRIFDKDGKIILSTKKSEIGNMTSYEYFKTELPKGEIYFKVGDKEYFDKEKNENTTIEVAEIYVPIMFGERFDGASEVYFNITNQKNDFKELLDKITTTLLIAALVFFAILFFVLYLSSKNNLIQKNKEVVMFEQSKLASLGEMIGNIAHQWRQPLSMISTSITTLKVKNDMNIMDEKDLNDTVNNIVQSTEYLSDTIEDFRNFFDKDKDKTIINIKDLVDSTVSIVKDSLKSKNINLITSLESFEVEVLENELKQVLINIINNAKDALVTNENSTITNKLVLVNSNKVDNKLVITIQDNAGGVPDKIMSKIFEPYFTTKHKSIGTGIGLYMCKSIIENNLNGNIKVSNNKFNHDGKSYYGAKFSITI